MARSVRCRSGTSRLPLTSSASESASRVRIAAGGNSFTRAAASSIASGSPSSRRTSPAMASAFSPVMVKPGTEAAARAANSSADSHPARDAAETGAAGSGRSKRRDRELLLTRHVQR